jgi:hypothetical protein
MSGATADNGSGRDRDRSVARRHPHAVADRSIPLRTGEAMGLAVTALTRCDGLD